MAIISNHPLAGVVNKNKTEKTTEWTIHRHRKHWTHNTMVKEKQNTKKLKRRATLSIPSLTYACKSSNIHSACYSHLV
jgi:hypothetical protein